MRRLSIHDFDELIKARGYPCLSLYVDLRIKLQGHVNIYHRLRSQLDDMEKSLGYVCSADDRQVLMKPLRQGAGALYFTPYRAEGLAMFSSFDISGFFPTSIPVKDYVAISDSFHLKPILPMIQKQTNFHVVTLARNQIILFGGDASGLKELKRYNEAPAEDVDGTVALPTPARLRRFFNECQADICNVIKGCQGPVITIGSAPLRKVFASGKSHIPHLLKEGINFRYTEGNLSVLHKFAWNLADNFFRTRAMVLSNQYLALRSRGKASHHLPEIAESIFLGRVAHILVSRDQSLYGRLDRDNGRIIRLKQNQDPVGDDVLCDLAQEVILRGGNAHVLPQTMMPTPSPVAALFRW
jgi:hypothetical protein